MASETISSEPLIKVISMLGAAVIAGRTHEAVRTAVQQGRVEVAAGLYFGAHPSWLLELDDVVRYWEVPSAKLDSLREDVILEAAGQRWRVMTPTEMTAAIFPRPWGSGPLWFRTRRGA